jgi:hypothetical protein
LRFHDLRHEATSRLCERGYQIHEVAQCTLHESWNELKRYTNLRPENLTEITAPKPEGAAWQQLRRRAPTRLLAAESKVLWRHALRGNAGFTEFRQQTGIGAVHKLAAKFIQSLSAYFVRDTKSCEARVCE